MSRNLPGLSEGVAFVRTTNLDGETNLKVKTPVLISEWPMDSDLQVRHKAGRP